MKGHSPTVGGALENAAWIDPDLRPDHPILREAVNAECQILLNLLRKQEELGGGKWFASTPIGAVSVEI